ncbi:MAG: barstar family protein [Clostridia bacterium]|nr:barstar family protein [Clostridia bacterium]
MKIIIIDAKKFTSKPDAHEHIAASLDFPAYYGKNLDALADCLSELAPTTAVIIKNTADASDCAKPIFEVFDEMLGEDFRVLYFK